MSGGVGKKSALPIWTGLSVFFRYDGLYPARLQGGFHAFPPRIEWFTQSPIHRSDI